MQYFVLLRWPPDTPRNEAPQVVRRAFALPGTTLHTVYAVLPGGMLQPDREALKASGSVAICIAAVPDLQPELQGTLQGDIVEAFGGGALLCRFDDKDVARSSVAWTTSNEVTFPADHHATLADLQQFDYVPLLEAILACAMRLRKDAGSKQQRRRLNGVLEALRKSIRVAKGRYLSADVGAACFLSQFLAKRAEAGKLSSELMAALRAERLPHASIPKSVAQKCQQIQQYPTIPPVQTQQFRQYPACPQLSENSADPAIPPVLSNSASADPAIPPGPSFPTHEMQKATTCRLLHGVFPLPPPKRARFGPL